MKIFVTGTRGIPGIPGGIEKHCEELYPRIANKGYDVILATRSCYVSDENREWNGVKLIRCYAPRLKILEAFLHTFLALLSAKRHKVDIVHIHAIGPSLLAPLARMMGLKVVITNHGPEYNRQKWGKVAKTVLKIGEIVGAKFAHEIIAVSTQVHNILIARAKKESAIIPNGVPRAPKIESTEYLMKLGLNIKDYILTVARFVPEKGLHDLIAAYGDSKIESPLVIAGDADHKTNYSRKLKQQAGQMANIKLTGYITGDPLLQLYTNAKLFVLPSYHEGLPIVLLEAMSFGLPVLASDITANKEIGLEGQRYFRCGDINNLKEKLQFNYNRDLSEGEQVFYKKVLNEIYNWDRNAEKTIRIYERAIRK
jgi:glycosyltransferase involved in cell wall biosynthesis